MTPPYGLLTIFAIAAFPFAWVVNQVWKHSFGVVFTWLGNLGLRIPLPGLPDVTLKPFGFLLGINEQIQGFFSSLVASCEHAIVTLWKQIIAALTALSHELWQLSLSIEKKLGHFATRTVPRALLAALRTLGLGFLLAFHAVETLVLAGLKKLRLGFLIGLHSVEGLVHKGLHALRLAWLLGLHSVESLVHQGLRKLHLLWLLGWNSRKHFLAWLASVVPGLVHFGGKAFHNAFKEALRYFGIGNILGTPFARWIEWLVKQEIHAVTEWARDALEFVAPNDICTVAQYNYDVAVYVFEPIIMETIGVTSHICGDSGKLLGSAMTDEPYVEAWAPSATPAITGPFQPQRLAPNIPLPRGVVKA